MTKQELFDKVVRHLRAQGARSVDDMNDCKYRGGGDLKCALGCLIPDETYAPWMEEFTPTPYDGDEDAWNELMGIMGLTDETFALANRLQTLHDGTDPQYWERSFRELAKEFGLEVPK